MRRPRNHVLVHEVRVVVARRCQRADDGRRVHRILQLEQAAVGRGGSRGGRLPGFLRRNERSPGRPERGVERDVAAGGQAVPDRVGLTRQQVMALHARLTRFEHSEQVTALVRPVSLTVFMSQLPELGMPAASWVSAVGNGPLPKVRIAEGDRRGFVGGRAGRAGQRREIRKAGAVAVRARRPRQHQTPGDRQPRAIQGRAHSHSHIDDLQSGPTSVVRDSAPAVSAVASGGRPHGWATRRSLRAGRTGLTGCVLRQEESGVTFPQTPQARTAVADIVRTLFLPSLAGPQASFGRSSLKRRRRGSGRPLTADLTGLRRASALRASSRSRRSASREGGQGYGRSRPTSRHALRRGSPELQRRRKLQRKREAARCFPAPAGLVAPTTSPRTGSPASRRSSVEMTSGRRFASISTRSRYSREWL